MERGVELLNRRVVMRGVELGRVVDVILDAQDERVIGVQVLCGDGEHRFLPIVAARLGTDEVEVDSILAMLEPSELDFYRRRGRSLRKAFTA